jgi:hypothetical protein
MGGSDENNILNIELYFPHFCLDTLNRDDSGSKNKCKIAQKKLDIVSQLWYNIGRE